METNRNLLSLSLSLFMSSQGFNDLNDFCTKLKGLQRDEISITVGKDDTEYLLLFVVY